MVRDAVLYVWLLLVAPEAGSSLFVYAHPRFRFLEPWILVLVFQRNEFEMRAILQNFEN